jgi:hypothetical protein
MQRFQELFGAARRIAEEDYISSGLKEDISGLAVDLWVEVGDLGRYTLEGTQEDQ